MEYTPGCILTGKLHTMKNFIHSCACILCVSLCNLTVAQSVFPAETRSLNDTTFAAAPLVCQLTGPEMQVRKAALQQVIFSKVTAFDEVETGFVFHFADQDDFLLHLIDYMLAEQACCPFFQFDLSIQANHGGIVWQVSGPPAAKEMLKSLIGGGE